MYATFMTLAGFDVVEAATGPDGLAMAMRLLPDLIVMDLSLPGLDGWEVTRRLTADPLTKHIPVLALTSHALDPEDLVKEIRRLLAQTLDERPAQ